MNKVVVKIEKSGNRYNAWDSDGKKWTSEIGTGTRKKAFNAGMALEKREGKKVSCLEEIAYKYGYIDNEALNKIIKNYNNKYGDYLKKIIN